MPTEQIDWVQEFYAKHRETVSALRKRKAIAWASLQELKRKRKYLVKTPISRRTKAQKHIIIQYHVIKAHLKRLTKELEYFA